MMEDITIAKIVQFYRTSTKLRICENLIIVLPVNILMTWCAGFFGCMTFMPCALVRIASHDFIE